MDNAMDGQGKVEPAGGHGTSQITISCFNQPRGQRKQRFPLSYLRRRRCCGGCFKGRAAMGLFTCCWDGKEAGKTRHVFEPLEDETDDTLSCEFQHSA